MNRYFYCYSYPLKEFLTENSLRYITSSVNANTQKKFWVFEGTDELNHLLDIWRVRKG
jgi:hypothetical protein